MDLFVPTQHRFHRKGGTTPDNVERLLEIHKPRFLLVLQMFHNGYPLVAELIIVAGLIITGLTIVLSFRIFYPMKIQKPEGDQMAAF